MPEAKRSAPISETEFAYLQEAFMANVNRETGIRPYETLTDDCYDWSLKASTLGGGTFQIDLCKKLGITCAYRLSMYLFRHAEFMENETLEVAHACDRRICVNPAHLRMATHAENMADRDSRGRGADAKGENNHFAKFNAEQIKEIQELRRGGMIYKDIAARYNVAYITIKDICLGKKGYSDEAIKLVKPLFRGKGEEIMRLKASGMSHGAICRALKTSSATLVKVLKHYKDNPAPV
jgi:hypothetical protein